MFCPSIQIISQDDKLMLEVYDYTELERILSGGLKRESDFNSSSKRIAYLLKRLIESTSLFLLTTWLRKQVLVEVPLIRISKTSKIFGRELLLSLFQESPTVGWRSWGPS